MKKLSRIKKITILTFFVLLVVSLGIFQNCANANFSKVESSSETPPVESGGCEPTVAKNSIKGRVIDATNKSPVAGATVTLKNAAGTKTVSTSATDSAGNYTMTGLDSGSFKLVVEKNGFIAVDQTVASVSACSEIPQTKTVISPNLLSGQMRIVLTWTGAPPNWLNIQNTYQTTIMDIDSYLLVPGHTKPIFWNNCNRGPSTVGAGTGCDITGAYLDTDEIDWNGPETITISEPTTGTYTYYVVNYSAPCNPLALGASSVVVTVYSGTSMIKRYTIAPNAPPQGSNGLAFEVFRISNGVIADVNQYNDSLWNSRPQHPTCDQLGNYL